MRLTRLMSIPAAMIASAMLMAAPAAHASVDALFAPQNNVTRAVVKFTSSKMGKCTATKIAPKTFLTARHCVMGTNGLGYVDLPFGQGAQTLITASYLHPTEDLAILRSLVDVPVPIAPISTQVPAIGEINRVYGYGNWPPRTQPSPTQVDVKVTGNKPKPGEAHINRFVVQALGNSKIIPGDSGGPMVNNRGEIVGALSTILRDSDNPYASREAYYSPVGGFINWINETIATATQAENGTQFGSLSL